MADDLESKKSSKLQDLALMVHIFVAAPSTDTSAHRLTAYFVVVAVVLVVASAAGQTRMSSSAAAADEGN